MYTLTIVSTTVTVVGLVLTGLGMMDDESPVAGAGILITLIGLVLLAGIGLLQLIQ